MPKRKKRLKKGIESLKKQIKFHEEKKEKAHEEGQTELERYYEKEIKGIRKTIERKKQGLK